MGRYLKFAAACSASLVASCSSSRVDERMTYWSKVISNQVPSGSTIESARSVLATHGLSLTCCVSGPDEKQSYFAVEKRVGRFLFTEYDVAVIINVSKDNHVADARVEKWGVGP